MFLSRAVVWSSEDEWLCTVYYCEWFWYLASRYAVQSASIYMYTLSVMVLAVCTADVLKPTLNQITPFLSWLKKSKETNLNIAQFSFSEGVSGLVLLEKKRILSVPVAIEHCYLREGELAGWLHCICQNCILRWVWLKVITLRHPIVHNRIYHCNITVNIRAEMCATNSLQWQEDSKIPALRRGARN